MLKEVMRTGPGLGVAGEGVTEDERIELGPEPGEDLVDQSGLERKWQERLRRCVQDLRSSPG